MNTKTYWNHRLIYTPEEGYFFAEVYYEYDIPKHYGNAQKNFDSKKSAKWTIRRLWEALRRPILNGDQTDSENFLKPIN